MAIASVLYLGVFLLLLPATEQTAPALSAAFAQLTSATTLLGLQLFWIALFLYYGRSRVTASRMSFHVVSERI
jgi:hypothetical protein